MVLLNMLDVGGNGGNGVACSVCDSYPVVVDSRITFMPASPLVAFFFPSCWVLFGVFFFLWLLPKLCCFVVRDSFRLGRERVLCFV